jgi:hypothetical protein
MYLTLIDLCGELMEERLLQVFSGNEVLPYQDLKTRAALIADDRVVRRVLNGLIARGLMQRQADRKRPLVPWVRQDAGSGACDMPRRCAGAVCETVEPTGLVADTPMC